MSQWWLITWTTYGTWLPGDPRGFQTWQGHEFVPPPARYAKLGEPTYNLADYAERYDNARRTMVGEPVRLSTDQQRIALGAIVAEVGQMPLVQLPRAHSSTEGSDNGRPANKRLQRTAPTRRR